MALKMLNGKVIQVCTNCYNHDTNSRILCQELKFLVYAVVFELL